MTTIAIATHPRHPGRPLRDRIVLAAVAGLSGLVLAALLRRLASGGQMLPSDHTIWLTVHLCAVIPALPLGLYVLWRRKGDRPHRLLGRIWAGLMLLTALSSFGLRGFTGHFSWIHLLSIVVLTTIPRGVMQVMRGDIAAHKRSMTLTYAGLVAAGAFTFVPGRLLSVWLFG